jgi:hypothetical protein
MNPGSLAAQKKKKEPSSAGASGLEVWFLLTILLTSSTEPGSTEQADFCILDRALCDMSEAY